MDFKEKMLILHLRQFKEEFIEHLCDDYIIDCERFCDGGTELCIIERAAYAIETLLAERDALMKELSEVSTCTSCKFYKVGSTKCDDCGAFVDNWEWRGLRKG